MDQKDLQTIEKLKTKGWKFSTKSAQEIHEKAIDCGYIGDKEEYHFLVYVLGISYSNWKNYLNTLKGQNKIQKGKYTVFLDATKEEKEKREDNQEKKDKETIEELRTEGWKFSTKTAQEIYKKAIKCGYIGDKKEYRFFVYVLGIGTTKSWKNYQAALNGDKTRQKGRYTVFLDATKEEKEKREDNQEKKDKGIIEKLKKDNWKFTKKTAQEIRKKAIEYGYIDNKAEYHFFVHLLGIGVTSWKSYIDTLKGQNETRQKGKYRVFLDATKEEKKKRENIQKKKDKETTEKLKRAGWKYSTKMAREIHEKAIECGYIEEEEYRFFAGVLGIGSTQAWENYLDTLDGQNEYPQKGKYTVFLDATKEEKENRKEAQEKKDKETIEKLKKAGWKYSIRDAKLIHKKAIDCGYIGDEEEFYFFVHVLGISENSWENYLESVNRENTNPQKGKYTVFLEATDLDATKEEKEKRKDDQEKKDEETIEKLKEENWKFSIKTAKVIHEKAMEYGYIGDKEEWYFFVHVLGIDTPTSWRNYKMALEKKDLRKGYMVLLDATKEEKEQNKEEEEKKDKETIEKLKEEGWKFNLKSIEEIHSKAIEMGYIREDEEYRFFARVIGKTRKEYNRYQKSVEKEDKKYYSKGRYRVYLDATEEEKFENNENLNTLMIQIQKKILSDGYYPGKQLDPYQINDLYNNYIIAEKLPIRFNSFLKKILDVSSGGCARTATAAKENKLMLVTINLNKRIGHEYFIKEYKKNKKAGLFNRYFTKKEIETICTENGIDLDFFIIFIIGTGYNNEFIEDYKNVLKSNPNGIWVGNNIPLSKEYLDKNLFLLQKTIKRSVNKFCDFYNCCDRKEDYIQDTILFIRENAGEIEKNFEEYNKRTIHHFSTMIKTNLYTLYFGRGEPKSTSMTKTFQKSGDEYIIEIPYEEDFELEEDEELMDTNEYYIEIDSVEEIEEVVYTYIKEGIFNRGALMELLANSVEGKNLSPEEIEKLILDTLKSMIGRGRIELTRRRKINF